MGCNNNFLKTQYIQYFLCILWKKEEMRGKASNNPNFRPKILRKKAEKWG